MICAQVHSQCHNSCACYMLGARYLYFKRNTEKFEVHIICKVCAIGRKIRLIAIWNKLSLCVCLFVPLYMDEISNEQKLNISSFLWSIRHKKYKEIKELLSGIQSSKRLKKAWKIAYWKRYNENFEKVQNLFARQNQAVNPVCYIQWLTILCKPVCR
jgi:hypothetical protein